jgi:hypothetical protein
MTTPQASRGSPGQAWFQGVRPAAVALPDDRVLVVGWDPSRIDDSMRSLQLYDPISGSLSAIDVPPGILELVVRSATLLPDGRVLFLDGDDDVLEAIAYDPASDAWEREGTTPPRIAFTATVAHGLVLIAGGRAGGGPGTRHSPPRRCGIPWPVSSRPPVTWAGAAPATRPPCSPPFAELYVGP